MDCINAIRTVTQKSVTFFGKNCYYYMRSKNINEKFMKEQQIKEEIKMEYAPLVSVIVPIYNAERYIRRCLDSIRAQTFQNFEVIMINDGTTDSSADIAGEYTVDPRFKLYNQDNRGVGYARNRGLEMASGEYVAFVDSDDAIVPEHLEKLYAAAAKEDADIVCCGYCCCDDEGGHLRTSKITKRRGVYSSEKLIGNIIRDISIRRYLWSKLWRRSLFISKGISFPCITFEDACIIPILFYNAKRIAVITDRTYIYTCRNSSITGLTAKSCIGDYITANEKVEDYFLSRPEYEYYISHLIYQRCKTFFVTFAWLFVRLWRIKSFDYFGGNLKKILRYTFAQARVSHTVQPVGLTECSNVRRRKQVNKLT